MKKLPVSEDMKQRLSQYFDETTQRYDVDTIREVWFAEEKAKCEAEGVQFRFYNYFGAGFDDGDQAIPHDIVSAAVQLNEELERQEYSAEENNLESFSDADNTIIHEIITGNIEKFEVRGWASNYWYSIGVSDSRLRNILRGVLAFYDRAVASDKHVNKNHILHFLAKVQNQNGDNITEEGGSHQDQNAYVNLGKVRQFIDSDTVSGEPFLFADETEEYLASIGL